MPKKGALSYKLFTNAGPDDSKFLSLMEELRNGLPNIPALKRSSTRLDEQFTYKYFTNLEGTFSIYIIRLRQTFAAPNMVSIDEKKYLKI